MYYPQQSPGINPKLGNLHDQSPWTRPHHSILVPPGSQNSVGPGPPQSPGYALYANGPVNSLPHPQAHHPLSHPSLQHHHHNSLSHYPSPPNGTSHQQHPYAQASPASVNGQIMSQHWQQQLLKCEVSCHSSDLFVCSLLFILFLNRWSGLRVRPIIVLGRALWLLDQ